MLKKIDDDFKEPMLPAMMVMKMETAPFAEVSRRLDFPMTMIMESAAYDTFIAFPGESDLNASTAALRWNNVLTEIAALRLAGGNFIVPATFSVRVEGVDGVTREVKADLYIDEDDDGKPAFLITTEKGRLDFLNGTVQ
jgi:hypothetical protein